MKIEAAKLKPGQYVGVVKGVAQKGDLVAIDMELTGGSTAVLVSKCAPDTVERITDQNKIDDMYVALGVMTREEVAASRFKVAEPKTRVCSVVGTEQKLIDDLTPDECLQRYALAQREGLGDLPPLTRLQLVCARSLWSHDVKMKVRATTAQNELRERTQVVCDDDRWEE